MSGGGGGGYDPPEESDCSKLRVRTQLRSPDPAVISKLVTGQTLAVRYTAPKGPLLAIAQKGAVAGSIVTSKQVDIVNCINNGFSFVAEVLSVNGGKCEIEVKAK
jgi:hypothetical protein